MLNIKQYANANRVKEEYRVQQLKKALSIFKKSYLG